MQVRIESQRTLRLLLARPHTRTFMAGGYGAGDPPDPIPNSEVKTRCADGTAGATRWESTAPPAYYSNARSDPRDRSGRLSFPREKQFHALFKVVFLYL